MAHIMGATDDSYCSVCLRRMNGLLPLKLRINIYVLLLFMSSILCSEASARNWTVTPHLDLSGIVTDNISLAPPGQESRGYIARTVPGIDVSASGRRLTLDGHYQLESLLYPNRHSFFNNSKVFHQLQGDASMEVVKNTFFLDTTASFDQQTINVQDTFSVDNLNDLGNRGNVLAFNFSPRIQHEFGSDASTEIRYNYGFVDSRATGDRLDAESNSILMNFKNGRRYTPLEWDINYHHNFTNREGVSEDRREMIASANFRYKWSRALGFVMKTGYQNNDAVMGSDAIDGTYWSVGMYWEPSGKLLFEGTVGEHFSDASFSWNPQNRTSMQLHYVDNGIGLNPGASWSFDLSHRLKHATLSSGYQEESTNLQSLQLSGQQLFSITDADGNIVVDPVTGLPIFQIENLFTLTNEQFIRKNSNISVMIDSGKSRFSTAIYNEQRIYDISKNDEELSGGHFTWDWRFASRTHSIINYDRQFRKFSVNGFEDNFWIGSYALMNNFASNMTATLEMRRSARNAPSADDDYRESRITATLGKRF